MRKWLFHHPPVPATMIYANILWWLQQPLSLSLSNIAHLLSHLTTIFLNHKLNQDIPQSKSSQLIEMRERKRENESINHWPYLWVSGQWVPVPYNFVVQLLSLWWTTLLPLEFQEHHTLSLGGILPQRSSFSNLWYLWYHHHEVFH